MIKKLILMLLEIRLVNQQRNKELKEKRQELKIKQVAR
ncbi:hypothetical protein SAMN05192546_1208 [Tindallia californiensis]|uniref:Uncharacterized protein n=1 Tax=Tindallia californiensis TaxID=159292 RepID=A0A1H3RF31_9FIRM|nr:hypothetical protein SAMN05192546_1208 [Tindallia californiensis]